MRFTPRLLLACTVLAASSGMATGDPPAEDSAVRLHVGADAGADGTGVLIHRNDRGSEAVLYFLTSSHLFRGADGEKLPHAQPVRVWLAPSQTLDVRREDVFIPAGPVIDVVIMRATAAATRLMARPLSYESPSVGDAFLVAGHDRHGAPMMVAERIRFKSTLLAVGDRKASALVGCIGAPAISQQGVFGLVTECAAGRAPVIALLSMARSFIERHLPASSIRTSAAPF